MQLMLMRHGEASYHLGDTDHQRPLTAEGFAQARQMGQWMKDHGFMPDAVHLSSALRTRQTYEAWAAANQFQGTMVAHDALYLAAPETMLQCIHQAAPDHRRIMVLGHNPGITRLCAELTAENRPFGTACLAILEHQDRPWTSWLPNHEARLTHFERPAAFR